MTTLYDNTFMIYMVTLYGNTYILKSYLLLLLSVLPSTEHAGVIINNTPSSLIRLFVDTFVVPSYLWAKFGNPARLFLLRAVIYMKHIYRTKSTGVADVVLRLRVTEAMQLSAPSGYINKLETEMSGTSEIPSRIDWGPIQMPAAKNYRSLVVETYCIENEQLE